MVPASAAAAQIRAMLSAAAPAPRYSPTAVGLTETSAAPPWVSPSAPSLPSSCDVLVGDRGGLSLVLGVLAQVVQRDEQARGPQRPGHPHRVLRGFPGHVGIDDGARGRRGRDELAQPRTG